MATEQTIKDPREIGTQGLTGLSRTTERPDGLHFGRTAREYNALQNQRNRSAAPVQYLGELYPDAGSSSYDTAVESLTDLDNLQNFRGEEQPWYMQLLNGTLKGVLTAGETFVNGTLGLVWGIGQGIANLADDDENTGFWQCIRDNDITRTMQAVSDWQEKVLPNYYTDAERNDPWYEHIFSSNFIGDKFIKNIGFTVGAFYSGGLYSKALSAIGKASQLANGTRALVASGISAVGEGSIEALNNSREWYDYHKQLLDDQLAQDTKNLYDTEFKARAEAAQAEYEANAGKTFARDPDGGGGYDPAYRKYQQTMAALQTEFNAAKQERLTKNYDLALAKLNEDRAKMGNADLFMNIPILTASNMFQFGKLWANGFKTAGRTSKIVNTTGKGLGQGARYEAQKSAVEPWLKGVGDALSEGFEEINQKAASEIAGNYYGTDVMNFYKQAKDPDAELETLSWINSFGEGIAKTYSDPSSWEEWFIGALTGGMGMPVFGKANTQQAYLGKDKSFGMAGGIFGEFREYNERVQRDQEIANALNERVQSPDFLNYYQGMIRHYKLQSEMDKAVDSGDEFEFKNHEHSQLVNDIAMWDNAGRIDDLIQMVEDATDTSPENIQEIIRQTTTTLQAHPQYQRTIDTLSKEIDGLQGEIDKLDAQANTALEAEDWTTYNEATDKKRNLENQKADKEYELRDQQQRRDLFVGPFVDERGNPYSEDYIREKLEGNKKDLLDAINLYRKTKQDIDSQTHFRLNSEQLGTLTWLKTHMENWNERASDMAGSIKELAIPAILDGVQRELDDINDELNNMPETLREEHKEKAKKLQEDTKVLMDIKESLTKMQGLDDIHFARALAISPQIGQLLKLAMTKPDIAQQIMGDNVWNLMRQVDDTIKATQASMQYNQKLMEYLLNPSALEEDMAVADQEALDKFVERQTQQVRKNIVDNVQTVQQMKEALQGLGEHHDAVVEQLTQDEDERVAKLAQAYQAFNSLQRIGDEVLKKPLPTEERDLQAGATGAQETFNRIMETAENTDDAINKLKQEVELAQGRSLESTFDAPYEGVVADRLQQIIDAFEEAKKAKRAEGKDSRKPTKKPKSTTKKKKGKKPSLLDDDDDTDDGADDDTGDEDKDKGTGKKRRKKPSLLDDIDESGDTSEEPDGADDDEGGTPKKDITLDDVFSAYEKLGGTVDEDTKQTMRDRMDEEGTSVRDALADPELQDIYDELEAGTFDQNFGDDAESFQVGDEITGENYDADGNVSDTWKKKVTKVFPNGGIKVDDGTEYSPRMVREFFGKEKPFTQGAHSRITENSRLGKATPYKGAKKEGKKKGKIDFSQLGSMSVDEAMEFIDSLDPKDLTKEEKKKLQKLLKRMVDRDPAAHEDGDDDNSNANDNDSRIGSDPRFRSWGAYAKYMFQELSDRATRRAVYNSFSGAQEQLAALEELGAFDFVDKGELGKLFKAEPDLHIRYIKAKDKRLSDSVLLAVEMTKERQRRAKATRLITGSDGKQYQVVGMLGFSKDDDAANANWHEVQDAIHKERGKDRPDFFVSEKFYNKIKHIYSGRMVKSGEVVSRGGNVSGDIEDRSLKQMLHGVKPIIGIYYNAADFRIPQLPNGADVVPLNTNNSNPREGSVWLMVQEADGRYYAKAVKVRRFNLDEYDLEEHKDSPILQQIREDLEIICDPEASDIDRYTAKYDLQEHLLYFPDGIDILYNGDVVSITGVDWGGNIGKGLSAQEKAEALLERLQNDDLNLRFQIDTSELTESEYVQDLLDSDVMTSDLLQAHNINASFDLYLNDAETGEPIESDSTRDGSNVGHTGNREVNTDLAGTTVNIGRSEYTYFSDGSVKRRNQVVTDPKVITQVHLIHNINQGLVNPIEGTNIYLGTYDDGTEFGIKKTKTSHTILEGDKLSEAKKKTEKVKKKKAQRKSLKEITDGIAEDEEAGLSDEELLKKARRGVIKPQVEEEDTDEGPSDEELLRGSRRGLFKREEGEKPAPKPKRKGPVLLGHISNEESAPAEQPVTASQALTSLARKRANRERILRLAKNGKRMFDSLNDFYKYIQDPANGFANVEINTDADMQSVLDTIEHCR